MVQSIIIVDPKTEISGKQTLSSYLIQPAVEKGTTRDISIKQIRSLQDWLQKATFQATEHRQVIIEQADRLSLAAQQALLKTLEEPDSQTTLILLTATTAPLLPTIQSRCAILQAHQVTPTQLTNWSLENTPPQPPTSSLLPWTDFIAQSPVDRATFLSKKTSRTDLQTLCQHWSSQITPTSSQDVAHLNLLHQALQHLKANLTPRLVSLHLQSQLD